MKKTRLGRRQVETDIIAIDVLTKKSGGTGVTDHGGLTGLGDDDHAQYVAIGIARTITAQHSFAPAATQAPFTLGANAQGQVVTGLRADQLNKQVIAGTALTDGGTLTADVTLNHATGDNGDLHTNYAEHDQPETISAQWTFQSDIQLDADLDFVGGQSITTTAGNLTISPAGDVLITPTGGDVQITGQLGIGVTPGVPFQIRSISNPQITIQYDASNASTIGTNSAGSMELKADTNVILMPTGDVLLNPTGNDVRPVSNYDLNLGIINKKWLTIHAAELWVNTLVAAETIATIGGRVAAGPTTKLTSDLAAGATTMYVEHNQITAGDYLWLESAGKVEFIQATSTPGGSGPYTYTVTRNLDGSGSNNWYAGDAILNTGAAGDGWIDIYSEHAIHQEGLTAGPTIVGNIRPLVTNAISNPGFESYTLGSELLTNPGFETAGGGGADIWGSWTEQAGDGTLADETSLVHSGSHAAKMTSGASANTLIYDGGISVTEGRQYEYSFYTRGDGTNAGRWGAYDVSNGAWIQNLISTGVTGTTYTLVTVRFAIPANCTTARAYLAGPSANGGIAYFDDATLKSVDIDNWVENSSNEGALEQDDGDPNSGTYALKLTQSITVQPYIYQDFTVAATQQYRVSFKTRGDGTAAGQWGLYDVTNAAWISPHTGYTSTNVTGTTYQKVEQTFTIPALCVTARLYFQAGTSDGDIAYFDDVNIQRIDNLAYNNWTEHWAIGNLDGLYGYTNDTYGLALGLPGKGHITLEPTNGLQIYDASQTAVISMPPSGNAQITGTLQLSQPGTISAGDGNVTLDQDGVWIGLGGVTFDYKKALNFGTPGYTPYASIRGYYTGTGPYTYHNRMVVRNVSYVEQGILHLRSSGTTTLKALDELQLIGTPVTIGTELSTANGTNTKGLTINQDSADDEILSLKSSDVTHSFTGITDDDTYGLIKKQGATTGGMRIDGFSSTATGLALWGNAETETTGKSNSANSIIEMRAFTDDGSTSRTAPSTANANLLGIRAGSTVRFLFDTEGDFHADSGSTTFDEFNDLELIDAFDKIRNPKLVHINEFNQWLKEKENQLVNLGILHPQNPDGSRMYNVTGLQKLEIGALRQLTQRLQNIEDQLATLTA